MNGKDLTAGAVSGVKKHINLSVCRKNSRNTQHVMLAGQGAMDFAKCGIS